MAMSPIILQHLKIRCQSSIITPNGRRNLIRALSWSAIQQELYIKLPRAKEHGECSLQVSIKLMQRVHHKCGIYILDNTECYCLLSEHLGEPM